MREKKREGRSEREGEGVQAGREKGGGATGEGERDGCRWLLDLGD